MVGPMKINDFYIVEMIWIFPAVLDVWWIMEIRSLFDVSQQNQQRIRKKKEKKKERIKKKRRERTFSVWATDVFPAMKKTSEGWSYLITWASSGGEEETSLELLLRGSLKPLTVNCLEILVLPYGWAETNEISHPGGQVVAELFS